MTTAPDDINAAALDWAIRTADPGFAEWEAFEAWLARDPRHAQRYDEVTAAVDDAAAALATVPVRVEAPARPQRRWWLAGSVAAALAVTLGWSALPGGPEPWTVAARPGTAKRIAFADGSTILLAGGSRVALDRADPRFASLEQGEALFSVRHDAARPYRVTAGEHELVDLGTVFNVKRGPEVLRVAVSEGEVMLDPKGARVRVPMGRAVTVDLVSRQAEVARVDPASVGAWRSGQLSYAGAPIAEVAADLARLTGRRITVAEDVRARRFNGTIDAAAIDRAELAALLGVTVREAGGGWELAR